MAVNSKSSVQNVKPITLNVSERLEIFQQALYDLQKAGVNPRISPLYGEHRCIIIVLEGVELINGNLVLEANHDA